MSLASMREVVMMVPGSMRSPDQHAAMLSYLNAVSWDCVLLENDTQMVFDQFYSVMLGILDYFLPNQVCFRY